ncbi:MAG: peptidoglycan DD-metalloendopeptidase family protein [Burkholderiales bacterium]
MIFTWELFSVTLRWNNPFRQRMNNNRNANAAQPGTPKVGRIRLRWLVTLSTLPLLGVVAAFGIAPGTVPYRTPAQPVTADRVALPVLQGSALPDDGFWHSGVIRDGDRIATVLQRLNIDARDIGGFLSAAGGMEAFAHLVPGRRIQAKTNNAGELLSLRYVFRGDTLLQAEKAGAAYQVGEQPATTESRVELKSGVIESSLFGATDAAGLSDAVAMQMVDIFSSDIDFHLDLRKGDTFSVVYETAFYNGEPTESGRVLAAQFTNHDKTYSAFYFTDDKGNGGYYTAEGANMRRAFLRSPLEFSRISSGFSLARFHPILKKWRAHKGVDYAASSGTRVRSTSKGTVVFAGRKGGYGNTVIVKHQGAYSTLYGHLKGYAKGMRSGARVEQGQVIGYVGQTGWATGPHLHYEFRVSNVQRNPLTVALPNGLPIPADDKPRFAQAIQPRAVYLDLLRATNLARLE